MLCIAGKRIATPVCGLVRNDKRFDTFCTSFGAECFENTVIARSEATWARAFAPPVADEAKAQWVQRSVGDEGVRAEDIHRAPQTEIRNPGIQRMPLPEGQSVR